VSTEDQTGGENGENKGREVENNKQFGGSQRMGTSSGEEYSINKHSAN